MLKIPRCARKLEGYGHTVKLMAPQFVKPYVKARTTQANQIRELLSGFGIVIPQGIYSVMK